MLGFLDHFFGERTARGSGHIVAELQDHRAGRIRGTRETPWQREYCRAPQKVSSCGVHCLHFISFLNVTPPFITNFTRSISVMSLRGSPATATRSAKRPFSTMPTFLPKS